MWGICQAQNLVSPLLLLLLLVSGEYYALMTAVKQDHYRGAAEGGGLDLLHGYGRGGLFEMDRQKTETFHGEEGICRIPNFHTWEVPGKSTGCCPTAAPLFRSFIEVVVKKEMWPGSDGCGLSQLGFQPLIFLNWALSGRTNCCSKWKDLTGFPILVRWYPTLGPPGRTSLQVPRADSRCGLWTEKTLGPFFGSGPRQQKCGWEVFKSLHFYKPWNSTSRVHHDLDDEVEIVEQ